MANNIKIFISGYKKESTRVNGNDELTVFVGKKHDDLEEVDFLKDMGENINAKIYMYHELIVQYWAWKNEKADYYGFCKQEQRLNCSREYENLNEVINNNDIVLPDGMDYTSWIQMVEKERFRGLDKRYTVDVEDVYTKILAIDPTYDDIIAGFKKNGQVYINNSYIMKRELFFNYCEFMFRILFDMEKQIDFSRLNEQEMYILLYMSELILSVYVAKLVRDKSNLKIKHLPIKSYRKMEDLPIIQPIYPTNGIPIALSCNEKYMPILGVMLKSLLDNAGKEYNYDLIVMQCNSKGENAYLEVQKFLIKKMVKCYSNASIRFVDVSTIINVDSFFVHYNYTPETYFRLFLPQILNGYNKILYMDADVIVRRDVAELYNTDLEGSIIGAVRDPIINGTAKSDRWNMRQYMSELGIKNIYNYFQAGILIIDINEISKDDLPKKMIDYAMTHECEMVDQDVLNLFCQDKVKFIDNKWNVDMNPDGREVIPAAPVSIWQEYQENRKTAYIYHFAGPEKPWLNPSLDKADIFWEVARSTPWYEQLLYNMMKNISPAQNEKQGFVWHFPYEEIKTGSNIAIYGAGDVGKAFKKNMDETAYAKVLLWVDRDYENLKELGVKAPESLETNKEIDNIIIAINNMGIAKEVKEYLRYMGIESDKIIWKDYSK